MGLGGVDVPIIVYPMINFDSEDDTVPAINFLKMLNIHTDVEDVMDFTSDGHTQTKQFKFFGLS